MTAAWSGVLTVGVLAMSSAAAASIKAFGVDRGLPFPLEDIPFAEIVLLVGSNPAGNVRLPKGAYARTDEGWDWLRAIEVLSC